MPENFTATFTADHVLTVAIDLKAGSRLVVRDGAVVGILPPDTTVPFAAAIEHEPPPAPLPPAPPSRGESHRALFPNPPPKAAKGKKDKVRRHPVKPVPFWDNKHSIRAAKTAGVPSAAYDFSGPVPSYQALYRVIKDREAINTTAIYEVFNLTAGGKARALCGWRLREMAKSGVLRNISDSRRMAVYVVTDKVPAYAKEQPQPQPQLENGPHDSASAPGV